MISNQIIKKTIDDLHQITRVDFSVAEPDGTVIASTLNEPEDMAEAVSSRETCRQLVGCMERVLDEREAQILRLRYGLDGGEPLTQRETARKCSISRSYVSRLEKRALQKLRQEIEKD